MKHSLIVGSVLAIAFLLLSFIIPVIAKDGERLDKSASIMMEQTGKTNNDFLKESKEDGHIPYYTENDIVMLAELLYNECRGVDSVTERACVIWTVLNRVDESGGASIADIVTEPNQFAYTPAPLWDDLLWVAEDVLSRWSAEHNGDTSVGRVLPPEYKWFRGDGEHNHFRNAYSGNYDIWDYSLPSPYES